MAAIDLLGVLQEECAEVIKEVSKVRRSGPDFKPFGGTESNQQHLELEVLDVLAIIEIARKLGVLRTVNEHDLAQHVERKWFALAKWTPEALLG